MSEELILEKIEGLKNITEERFDENNNSHKRLETNQLKTNGRVRLLEKAIWALSGGLFVISIIVTGIIIPTIVKYLTSHL